MPGPDAIERSQKKLYFAIKSELALFEKNKTKELLAYERSFQSALPKTIQAASKLDLLKAINRANIVLVGDFHSFAQSQKGFLRLLNESTRKHRRQILALECIQQMHQDAVNEFLANYLTIEELREKINFEKYWPFSWENYREILIHAKEMKIPVLALNILDRKRQSPSLQERDNAAAEIIGREFFKQKDSLFFVLYGDLHMARPHLPRKLSLLLGGKARVLVVHQNNSYLYWKTPKLKNGQRPEIVRLKKDEFCILNCVPWVKLRSYLDWLEGNPFPGEWGGNEEEIDAAGMVHHYSSLLAEAIGIPAQFRDNLDIFGPNRLISGALPENVKIAPSCKALARHALIFRRTDYLPENELLILPAISTNSLSEAASYLLWHTQRGNSGAIKSQNSRYFMAQFLVGYLGSKVLNPKRKCHEVGDLKDLLKEKEKRISRGQPRADVMRRALALLRPYLKDEKLPLRSKSLPAAREIEACRFAGFILAERFFHSYLNESKHLATIRAWFHCNSPQSCGELLRKTAAGITCISPTRKRDRF